MKKRIRILDVILVILLLIALAAALLPEQPAGAGDGAGLRRIVRKTA